MRFGIVCLVLACGLSGCGQEPEQEKINGANMYFENSGNNNAELNALTVQEPEGPQYQTPNIEVLKGKRQLYPAKYPLKRYPGTKVQLVDVRENRGPGYKNQVLLVSTDQMPKISNFYKGDLIKEGWKKVREFKNENYEGSTWTKGDLECEVRVATDFTAPPGSEKKFVQLLYGKVR